MNDEGKETIKIYKEKSEERKEKITYANEETKGSE